MKPTVLCMDLRNRRPRPSVEPPAPAVLCLGNFDGVHLAHAALLRAGRKLADDLNAANPDSPPLLCGAFCFLSPSGDYFLKENTRPTHLTTLEERLHLLQDLNVDLVWLCDFPEIQNLSPEDFLNLLQSRCGCVGVACGYNHRFGKGALGSPDLLVKTFGADRTAILPAFEIDGIPVSSSRIRACLHSGDMETAAKLLGRPYFLEARVEHGKSLGHTWGFPTANQSFPDDRHIPAHGVYAVLCHTHKGIFPGVANVGLRPTVEHPGRVNCETHIIGYSGDLYEQVLKIEFLKFLRPEQKFDSVEALTAAIRRDTKAAADYILGQP